MPEPLERIFLGWSTPALAAAASRLADHYAGKREIGLDRALVVLPGARAGRRLLEVLVDEAERRGLRLRPPRVTTTGASPERLYEPERPLADGTLARRAWVAALRGLEPSQLETVFAHPPDPSDPAGWTPLVREVERLHREIGGAGLSFADVAERCGEALPFDDGERWAALARAQSAYVEALESVERADQQFARIEALRSGSVGSRLDVWLVGVVDLPGIVREMLHALDAPVRALVHAPEERAEAFDADGCVVPDAWTDAEVPLPDERVAIGNRPSDQALEALRAVDALDAGYSAEEITIGVPDDTLVPHLERRLDAAGLPARYAAGVRLDRTGPHRLLAAIADYLDGRRFDALASLLRHPDLRRWWARTAREGGSESGGGGGSEGRSGAHADDREAGAAPEAPPDPLTTADAYFGRALPARLAEPLRGPDPERSAMVGVVRALGSDALLGRLEGRRRLAEWAPEVLGLLIEIYGGEPLDRGERDERRIVEACERIRDAALQLHRVPEALDEPCTAAAAIRLLLAEVGRSLIPPEPERAAIELLGWLELHLDDAPALVVAGFNEPHLPESVNADAFLPNALRTALGLADNALRYARDAYQLTAILESRPEVRVIAGRRDASGDPLRPSRLLFAAPEESVARRVLRFYDEEAEDAAAPTVAPSVADGAAASPPAVEAADSAAGDRAAGGGTAFLLPPEPVIRAPEPIDSLRVTDFRLLLRDPYRFALERVLRLEPVDDFARELDGAGFGSLAHAVLHRFGESDAVHETDADRVRAVLDELLDEAAGRRLARHALPSVRIQLEQLRARLRAFADWHSGWIAAGWRVVGVEQQPEGDGVVFDVDGEPVRLRGRIDRIDRHSETGEWALFDYKTSDRAADPDRRHRRGRGDAKEWIDLQLPLYRHLLPAIPLNGHEPPAPPAASSIRLGYILLPRELEEVGAAIADWGDDELAEADEAARRAVRELRDGLFRFDPDRVESYPGDPLAALLGKGSLGARATAEAARAAKAPVAVAAGGAGGGLEDDAGPGAAGTAGEAPPDGGIGGEPGGGA